MQLGPKNNKANQAHVVRLREDLKIDEQRCSWAKEGCNDPGTAVYQYQNTGRTLCLKAGHDISIIAHTRVRLNVAYPRVVSMGSNDTASSPALVWSEARDL